ncbi:MAG: hypothetical protein JWO38_6409 [Gemmataceae bacterium]|nr:hypothetical protein [Gemmataceae bacterium]
MDGERPEAAGADGPVVTADRVTVSAETVRIGAPRSADAPGEPKVQLIREDGVIRAIDVTCTCGERVRIRCEYS